MAHPDEITTKSRRHPRLRVLLVLFIVEEAVGPKDLRDIERFASVVKARVAVDGQIR